MSKEVIITRYPLTSDKSLLAKNAADELLLTRMSEETVSSMNLYIANDRFGFLTCNLVSFQPQVLINFKSQEKSISENLTKNNLPFQQYIYPLRNDSKKFSMALVKIPKSLDLFRLYLWEIYQGIQNEGVVLCGFMTKYFTAQYLTIASEFFESIEQSKAYKKARVLLLKGKKEIKPISLINELSYKGDVYRQYLGVFSASNIDYATQFFIEHLSILPTTEKILDLASGNGILAKQVRRMNPKSEIHLVDDFYLAVESSKLNLDEENTVFHFNDSLEEFEDLSFDMVVSNPPFHFDFETNIDVTFTLFRQVYEKLKAGGSFQLVANRHLPYKPYLSEIYSSVDVIAQNSKFIIYNCLK